MPDQPDQTSLVLSTNPGGLQWLADCPRLTGPMASGKLARRSRTVRFDTTDFRLYRRGIALQVHQEGNRFIQRLSASTGDVRGQDKAWETEISGPEPMLDRLPVSELGPVLAAIPEDELAPVMAWQVSRETRLLQEAAANGDVEVFEIAFDAGEIETGSTTIPLAEIEVTVLKGASDAPYRLALDLQQSVPLNIEPRSRFVRGLQHAAGMPPQWTKAKRPACAPGTNIDDAIADLFRAGLAHFLANEGAALDGRAPEGVHQVRVALRRMRSAWSAFGKLLNDETTSKLKADARWLAGNLGPARDWDVFLKDKLAEIAAQNPGDPALSALRRHAETARDAAYHQAKAALMSQRTTRFVLELGRWIEARGWRNSDVTANGSTLFDRPLLAPPPLDLPLLDLPLLDLPLRDFATTTLERQFRKVRKRGRGFVSLLAETRHALRIDIKKMRYTGEFFVALYKPAEARRFVAAAARLQDALGETNDVATLATRLDTLQAAAPDDTALARGIGLMIGAANAHASATGERDARDAWRRFKRRRPFWQRHRS